VSAGEPGSLTDIAFETGVIAERKRLGDLIEAEIVDLKTQPVLVDREFIDGLERALELIDGEI
jgi:hypothetical protein